MIAVALAAPEPNPQFGYDYRRPSQQIPTGSYGAPQTNFVSGGTTGFDQGIINTGGISGIQTGGTSGIQTGGTFGTSGGTFGTSGIQTGGTFGTTGIQTGGTFGTTGISGGTTGGTFGTGGNIALGTSSIQRHVYVYSAPEEPEIISQKQISTGAAQKHYKIIFIKTPAPPSYTAPQIQALQQNQEKTLIYVLVKRPEDIGDISIPTAAPTQPSKPEVYFIKYKTQKTAQTGGTVQSTGTAENIGLSTGSKTQFTTTGTDFTSSSGGSVSSKYGPPGQSGPY